MSEIERPDRAEAHRRAETIRDGMRSYVLAMEAIGLAYEARDWVTLGYKDWDTYCEKEFSERRLKLTRDQREQAVLAFRGAGMSTRAIAAALGVGDATVRRDLSGASNDAPGEVVGTDGKTYPAQQAAAVRVDIATPADGVEDQVDLRSDEAPAAGDPGRYTGSPAVTPTDSPTGQPPAPDVSVRSLVAAHDQSEISHPAFSPGEVEDRGDSGADSTGAPPSDAPTSGEGPAAVSHVAGHPDPVMQLLDVSEQITEICKLDAWEIAQIGDQPTFDALVNAADDLAEFVLSVQHARVELDRRS